MSLQAEAPRTLLHKMFELQQVHTIQQSEWMRTIASTFQAVNKPRFEMVKPDTYYGGSSSPDCWIKFYEYACGQNCWGTDDDKIKNLRPFLGEIAKKWYELRVMSREREPWQDWRASFLSFGEDMVQAWDRAMTYKYRGGFCTGIFLREENASTTCGPRVTGHLNNSLYHSRVDKEPLKANAREGTQDG